MHLLSLPFLPGMSPSKVSVQSRGGGGGGGGVPPPPHVATPDT